MHTMGDELEKRSLFRRRQLVHGGFDFSERAHIDIPGKGRIIEGQTSLRDANKLPL
jgi:hypothetical protein